MRDDNIVGQRITLKARLVRIDAQHRRSTEYARRMRQIVLLWCILNGSSSLPSPFLPRVRIP
jgi:hypothetical protein